MAAFHQQSWVFVIKPLWRARSKIFPGWLFTENIWCSWLRALKAYFHGRLSGQNFIARIGVLVSKYWHKSTIFWGTQNNRNFLLHNSWAWESEIKVCHTPETSEVSFSSFSWSVCDLQHSGFQWCNPSLIFISPCVSPCWHGLLTKTLVTLDQESTLLQYDSSSVITYAVAPFPSKITRCTVGNQHTYF